MGLLVAGAVSLASALVAVAAGPVAASAPAPAECTGVRSLCLFEGTDFTGELLTLNTPDEAGECVNFADHGWTGRVVSAINTHTTDAALFANDDCVGDPFGVPGGGQIRDLGSFSPRSAWIAH
ncbi:peptidase inhibitor family I36 protein [Streptomyces sp. 6N223]|uniref:peptidase inhibitor family I36 protein n=1 Tax=Streptomyces sp. 6N223 TaxID=3457412 RepID=UPI003FCF3C86